MARRKAVQLVSRSEGAAKQRSDLDAHHARLNAAGLSPEKVDQMLAICETRMGEKRLRKLTKQRALKRPIVLDQIVDAETATHAQLHALIDPRACEPPGTTSLEGPSAGCTSSIAVLRTHFLFCAQLDLIATVALWPAATLHKKPRLFDGLPPGTTSQGGVIAYFLKCGLNQKEIALLLAYYDVRERSAAARLPLSETTINAFHGRVRTALSEHRKSVRARLALRPPLRRRPTQ